MQTSKRPVAIAYSSVSTDQRGKSGLGLADQKLEVADLCEQRAQQLEGEFTEVEFGKNDARPELVKALAAARRRSPQGRHPSQRTKAALAVAKARGVKLGRPENLTHHARRNCAATNAARAAAERAAIMPAITAVRAEGLSLRVTAERFGVSPMYVSRLLRRDAAGERAHA